MNEIALTTEMTPKIDTGGVAFGLRSRDYKDAQCVVIENHPNDSRVKIREDNTFQTLSSRMGTGGVMYLWLWRMKGIMK